MHAALLALKEKQKLKKDASPTSTVAFGASSPTLRNRIPTPPSPDPFGVDESKGSNGTASRVKERERERSKKDSLKLNGKLGIILTPTHTDRWRTKTRGFRWTESDPGSAVIPESILSLGLGKGKGPKRGMGPSVPSTEMPVSERMVLWSALIVIQNALKQCEKVSD